MSSSERLLRVLAVAALCIGVIAPTAVARPRSLPARIDRAEDCDPRAPQPITVWTGTGADVPLDVLVLLDGVAKSDAQEIFITAAESYAPLNITLVPTFRKAVLTPGVTRAEGLIAEARAQSAGARPVGIDVVYILTARDISIAAGDAVGYADCIGGIRYPNRAFAIGEAIDEPMTTGGLNFYVDGPAKTAAHEIGHLLGARHEHANCVQGISPDDVTGRQPTVCTLMTNYLDFQSGTFGSLESFVVRAYAETYAAP